MQSLVRATKQALQTGARSYAAASYPDRKVAVLGAAGDPHCPGPDGLLVILPSQSTRATLTPLARPAGEHPCHAQPDPALWGAQVASASLSPCS